MASRNPAVPRAIQAVMDSPAWRDNRDRRLALLALRTSYYQDQADVGLKPVDIALMDIIMQGHLEGRFVDISSLAMLARMDRATVRRRVRDLTDSGWLVQNRQGIHNYVYLTECAMKAVGEHLDSLWGRAQTSLERLQ